MDTDEAGVIARFDISPQGRVEHVMGLGAGSLSETRHFVASMDMVLETLTSLWADTLDSELGPLGPWMVRAGPYWVIRTGRRLWLLDGRRGDPGALLGLRRGAHDDGVG